MEVGRKGTATEGGSCPVLPKHLLTRKQEAWPWAELLSKASLEASLFQTLVLSLGKR